MLPRLRFVIASIAIAILPMVFLGSGAVPAPPPHAALTPAGGKSPLLAARTLPREPRVTSETQYRYEQHAMSFTRRSEELSRLRELASLSVNDWAAAPAGVAPAEPQTAGTDAAPAATTLPAPEDPPAAVPPIAVSPVVISPAVPMPPALAPGQLGPPAAAAAAASETPPDAPAPAIATAPPPAGNTAPPPAEDASAANKPAAEKTAADNPAPPADYAALTLDNDIKSADPPKIEAGASALTQVVVVASRKKPKKKVHRAAARRRAPRPVVHAPPPPPPAGPFAFFSWLFGQQPGQTPSQVQTQLQTRTPGQPQARFTAPAAPFSTTLAPRTAAR